jgi:hypothetical protein
VDLVLVNLRYCMGESSRQAITSDQATSDRNVVVARHNKATVSGMERAASLSGEILANLRTTKCKMEIMGEHTEESGSIVSHGKGRRDRLVPQRISGGSDPTVTDDKQKSREACAPTAIHHVACYHWTISTHSWFDLCIMLPESRVCGMHGSILCPK